MKKKALKKRVAELELQFSSAVHEANIRGTQVNALLQTIGQYGANIAVLQASSACEAIRLHAMEEQRAAATATRQ